MNPKDRLPVVINITLKDLGGWTTVKGEVWRVVFFWWGGGQGFWVQGSRKKMRVRCARSVKRVKCSRAGLLCCQEGRTASGQTLEACLASLAHAQPFAFGVAEEKAQAWRAERSRRESEGPPERAHVTSDLTKPLVLPSASYRPQ